jgi:DNA transposition AAA+ family ATPase
MVTNELKQRIVTAIRERRANYGSDAKMAVFLGINSAQYSRIMSGDIERVLSDANWISLSRKLEISINENHELVTAVTPVYIYISNQLASCQDNALSGMLCDMADIGKTYTAKIYVKNHKNAVYIDCSQVKSKQKLIRQIAKEFGLTHYGKYSEVYEDLVYYLKSIPKPLIVLDEAGDLDYTAFLELKALWNATERCCGWYMMGADGLKSKIESNLGRKKVGYTEMFSRYGSRYQKISPDGKHELDEFKKQQVALIAKANGITEIQKFYAKTKGSLRRISYEIQKLNSVA